MSTSSGSRKTHWISRLEEGERTASRACILNILSIFATCPNRMCKKLEPFVRVEIALSCLQLRSLGHGVASVASVAVATENAALQASSHTQKEKSRALGAQTLHSEARKAFAAHFTRRLGPAAQPRPKPTQGSEGSASAPGSALGSARALLRRQRDVASIPANTNCKASKSSSAEEDLVLVAEASTPALALAALLATLAALALQSQRFS